MVKKNKKKHKKEKQYVSTDVKDLGTQQLVQIDGKLYRLPDFRQMVMGLKHLYCKINSVLENYYFRNQLDPQDHKKNALRYVAGMKIEYLSVYSGKTRSSTFNWDRLDGIPLGNELFNVQKYDAEFEYNEAMKSTKKYYSIVYDTIIDNKPCGRGKKFEYFKESLDMLIEHFDIK
tara:strand:- start:766 stop:1290 length:525 start_codon:yes stop_codon:yes gene_type:complete